MGNCFLYKRGFGGGFGGGGEITPEVEKTASGKVISITDSAEKPLSGLRIFGKTTQNGTPSPDAPVPMESVGDGGSIVVSVAGKNLFSGWVSGRIFTSGVFVENVSSVRTDYIPVPYGANSFFVSGLTTDVVTMMVFYDIEKKLVGRTGSKKVSTLTHLAPENTAWVALTSYLDDTTDPIGDKAPQNVQIELGVTATAYEPYKEPRPTTLPTPNGLPGVHVSDGGKYTDENGWQWICDEVDFGRGKYVQNVYYHTFNGTESDIGCTAGKNWYIKKPLATSAYGEGAVISSHYHAGTGAGGDNTGYLDKSGLVAFKDRSFTDVDALKAYLAANPVTVCYPLATPIETDLTPEQLAAYAALHTLSPSTTIYNDADSYMEVKYIAKGG